MITEIFVPRKLNFNNADSMVNVITWILYLRLLIVVSVSIIKSNNVVCKE